MALLAGALLAPRLDYLPIGALAGAMALAVCLGWRRGAVLAAALCGLLAGALDGATPRALESLDPERPVEARGLVSTPCREMPTGRTCRLALESVAQGALIVVTRAEVALDLGGVGPSPPYGSTLRVRAFLTRAAGYFNEDPSPPGRFRLRCKSTALVLREGSPGWGASLLERAYRAVRAPFDGAARRHPGVELVRGIVLGEVEGLSPGLLSAFRRLGLAHLLAVSGMNVGIFAGLALATASWARRGWRLLAATIVVLLHLVLVGPVPSLARATVMCLLMLGGRAVGRASSSAQGLALAVAFLVVADPSIAADVGFQLSCAATAGLIGGTPWLLRNWRRRGAMATALAASLAAQAATLPIGLGTFSTVAPLAPLLNLVAVPLAALLAALGLVWLLLGLVVPDLASRLAVALDLLAWPLSAASHLPAGSWLALPLPPSYLLGTGIALLAIFAVSRAGRARVALLAGLLLAASPRATNSIREPFELVAPDVGQGQGILLRQGRRAVLVDGGGALGRDLAVQVWLPLLARRGLGSLDALVVSHPDLDHCGGLIDVAAYLPVGEIWSAAPAAESDCLRRLGELSGATRRVLEPGDVRRLGGITLHTLAPSTAGVGSDNDLSLVLMVEAGGRRILLPGDIERAGETRLVAEHAGRLRCDLLLVPHHGGKRSGGRALLGAASPRIAWIAAGRRNRFGHPARETLARLAEAPGRLILSTARDGELVARWAEGSAFGLELPASSLAVRDR